MIGGYIGLPIGGVASGYDRSATVSQTLADLSLSSASAIALKGSLTKTLDDVTVTFAGTVAIAGAAAVTLDDATLASASVLPLTGTLGATLDGITIAFAGAISIKANIVVTLDDLTTDLRGSPLTSITDTEVLQLPVDYVLAGQQHMPTGRGLTFEPGRGTASERVRVGAGARGRLKGPAPSFTVRTDSRGYN